MINKKYLNKLVNSMIEKKIDAFIIAPSAELKFLIGFAPTVCERFQAFIILSDGNYFHISPQLYLEEARKSLGDNTEIFEWADGECFLKPVKDAFDKYCLVGKTIAINSTIRAIDLIEISQVCDCKFENGHQILEKLRVNKTLEEIDYLKKAALITDKVMEEIIAFIRPGKSENDIRERIKELFLMKGADSFSFAIVASGPNSSKPHYNETARVIKEKDVIIMDIGCIVNGYCSDLSRTVFVGSITPEEEKIYNIVLEANIQAENYTIEGVTAESIDQKAREVIRDAGYGKYFINRTGHGIGICGHEAPYITPGNKQVIEKGMAFSIEPGIYLPDKFGVRIEDIVVITKNGTEVLSKFPKKIIIIQDN